MGLNRTKFYETETDEVNWEILSSTLHFNSGHLVWVLVPENLLQNKFEELETKLFEFLVFSNRSLIVGGSVFFSNGNLNHLLADVWSKIQENQL